MPLDRTQTQFRNVFSEYATPEQKDLPNMGEKERGPEAQKKHTQEQQAKVQAAGSGSVTGASGE